MPSDGGRGKARKSDVEIGQTTLYHAYKANCKRKGIFFDLSKDDFGKLLQEDCFYCKESPSKECTRYKWRKIDFKFNGIDRWVNSQGYTIDNVVPCCWKCNKSKGEMSGEEFIDLCKKVARVQLEW